MQERRALWTASSGRRQANRWLLLLLTLTGASVAIGAAQQGALPTLSGVWRLHETFGELPEQAVRALDGTGDSPANAIEHQVPGGGRLRARAERRDRALVATGQVAVKQGFLTRP